MSPRTRASLGAAVLTAALALAGCFAAPEPVVVRLPSDGTSSARSTPTVTPLATTTSAPAPEPVDPAEGVLDCAGAPVELAGNAQTRVITGDCPLVRVAGTAITVDATSAVVGEVTLSGDRLRLDARSIGDLTVEGNDDTVNAASTGAIVIRGARNTVTAPEGSASIRIAGNDNVVNATSGEVVIEGQGNTVG